MRLNVFEGARRIALLMGIVWAGGCVGYAVFNEPFYRLHFAIDWSKAPVLVEDCADEDARQYPDVKGSNGDEIPVALCFVASKASDGRMLVPYAEDPAKPGWLLMHGKYSKEVEAYTAEAAKSFRFPDSALKDAKARKWAAVLDQWKIAMQFLFSGLAIGWALVAATGWIVRGFLGIPRGKDARPDNA